MKVFLIWGLWGILWSRGMNRIAKRLLADGIDAEVWSKGLLGYASLEPLLAACRAAARAGKKIVLVGHSMGGVLATMVAQRLAGEGIKVELIVLFDACPPSHVAPIRANVKRLVNYYRKGLGLHGDSVRGNLAPSFAGTFLERLVKTWHVFVDNDPGLQAETVAEVKAARGAL